MATINLGRVKPVFQGAYDNTTAYVVDDMVTDSGNTYICILASTGNAVTNATYWTKMAAGSDLGGLSGLTAGDIAVYNGSSWVRQAIGTAGQALKVNSGANGFEFGSAGGLIQTVTSSNAFHTSNSTSWTSTGYEVTITPTSTSNKIHVHCNLSVGGVLSNATQYKIMRSINGAAYGDVDLPSARGSREPAHAGDEHHPSNGASHITLRIVDSTYNSTNAITYRLYKRQESSSGATVIGNYHNNDSNTSTAQVATINTNLIAEERT